MRVAPTKAAMVLVICSVALSGGCVDAFVEGLARGFGDGIAVVTQDFITQLPTDGS